MSLHKEIRDEVRKDLLKITKSLGETLEKIESVRERVHIKEQKYGTKKTIAIELDEKAFPQRDFKPLHEEFVEEYLEDMFGYQTLVKLNNNLTTQATLMEDNALCNVDIFNETPVSTCN